MLTIPVLQNPASDDSADSASAAQPPPLYIAPSRARQRFAARLAQRQKAMQDAENADETDLVARIRHDNLEDQDLKDADYAAEGGALRPVAAAARQAGGFSGVEVEAELRLNVGFESPARAGLEAGGSAEDRKTEQQQDVAPAVTSYGEGGRTQRQGASGARKGPGRFSGLFASDSDSD